MISAATDPLPPVLDTALVLGEAVYFDEDLAREKGPQSEETKFQ